MAAPALADTQPAPETSVVDAAAPPEGDTLAPSEGDTAEPTETKAEDTTSAPDDPAAPNDVLEGPAAESPVPASVSADAPPVEAPDPGAVVQWPVADPFEAASGAEAAPSGEEAPVPGDVLEEPAAEPSEAASPVEETPAPNADQPADPAPTPRLTPVTVTVTPPPGGSGSLTFTALVDGTGTNPTGTIAFTTSPDVGDCPTAALAPSGADDAEATCDITVDPGQSVIVTATYAGDGTHDPGSGSAPFTADQDPATVTLDPPTGTIGASGPVTFTATVSGAGATPTGTVDFVVDNADTCTGVAVDASGEATCEVTVYPGELIEVVANYSGDETYLEASSDPVTYEAKRQPVVYVNTTSGEVQGQAGTVSFTAAVGGAGTPNPTGTVTFTATAPAVGCTASLTPSGTEWGEATCNVTLIPPESEVTVTATYTSGDGDYEAGGSGSTVYQTPTATVTVAITAPPGSVPGDVPFTVTVTSSDGQTPTGTVTLYLDALVSRAGPVCTTNPLVPGPGAGQATGSCVLTVPAGASLTVSAYYNGSSHFFANTTQVTYQAKRAPAVSLTVSPASGVAAGTLVTFTAAVAADASGIAPTGTMRFDVAGTAVIGCEAVPVTAGQASCSTTALTPGTYQIVATYSGDAQYVAGSAEVASYLVENATAFYSPATGADVRDLLLGALLLILAGGGLMAFSSLGRFAEHPVRPRSGPARPIC